MKKKLIIAEKPDLAIKIVKAIGQMKRNDGYFDNDKYIVTFAFGHLFILKSIDQYLQREKTKWSMDELPFIPDEFQYVLKDDPGIRKQYKIIMNLYQSDICGIINAGDPDREGSVIILNIINQLYKDTGKHVPVERIWLKSTTPIFIQNALINLHPEEYYGNLYEEGLARTFTDWIYGINYSRYVSLKSGNYLPVGRVLIPIVKFVYDRDVAIHNFLKTTYFEIECDLNKNNTVIHCTINNSKFSCEDKGNAEILFNYLKSQTAIVKNIEVKTISKNPPKLFSLDTLQNKLAIDLKLSPATTLSILQKLYEAGYVTYPRTNTEYLMNDEIPIVKDLLNSLKDKDSLSMHTSKSIFDDSKIEGHTALIITNNFPDLNLISNDEKYVYLTIFNRFISNFLTEKTLIEETAIDIQIGDYSISVTGNTIKSLGFYKYETPLKESLLPHFSVGEIIPVDHLELCEKTTSPPKKVTYAELNAYLKNPYKKNEIQESDDDEYRQILSGCEIGTVATRASIIENAIKYSYIKKENGHLVTTDIGKHYIATLDKLGIQMNKDKTVQMSMLLKKIFLKTSSLSTAIEATSTEVKSIIDSNQHVTIEKLTNEGIGKCPLCGANVLEGKDNYFCSQYKGGCSLQIRKSIAGKKLTEAQIRQLLENNVTKLIKGFTSTKGNKFDAKIRFNKEYKTVFEFEK